MPGQPAESSATQHQGSVQSKTADSNASVAQEQKGSTVKTPAKKSSSSQPASGSSSDSQSKGSKAHADASATKSSTRSGSLAKTGAQSVLSLAAVGAFVLIAGATLMVLRRRQS